jgi:apolipoprotein D and lipocalin family protein
MAGKKRTQHLSLSLALGLWLAAPVGADVPSIDVQRYMGTWYQIALYPNRFQKQCLANTSASYRLLDNNRVEVRNRCTTAKGPDEAVGQARIDTKSGAQVKDGQLSPPHLQVRFAPVWLSWLDAVWGNYRVIQLAPDYRYAVVSEPSKEFLWVLARDTKLSDTDRQTIETRLIEQGHDPKKLVFEKH